MIEDHGQRKKEAHDDGDLDVGKKRLGGLHIVEFSDRQGQIVHDVADEVVADRRADSDGEQALDEPRTQLGQMRDERHAAVIILRCACVLRR